MANDHPVVLVHGLFGWGPGELADFPYWGTGRSVFSPLPRREASVGSISSVHDRACELAFQIAGGQVDYGEQHAADAGHDRFGRTYEGAAVLHSGWSEERPVHLVGHSMGGPTITMLQQLLAEDYFGWGSNDRWVRSISSISGALNGSTATYFLGCDEQTGLLDEDSAGGFLAQGIELFLRATGGLFDRFYDFDLDHWDGLATSSDEPRDAYLQRIAHSPMFLGTDNAAYSLTLQGLAEQNARCVTHPDTYYFSYVTEQTTAGYFSGRHYPEPDMNPFAIPIALYIGGKRFDPSFDPYPGFRAEDWWANDGLVSVYSQLYPRTAGDHPIGGDLDAQTSLEPGHWYYQLLDDVDHLDIVALPQLDRVGWQKRFYRDLFQRLAAL
jgi:triacylglycerol esterase/lipase EstA (alpha/beta hydrolase family)